MFRSEIKSARRNPLFVDSESARSIALGRSELIRMLPHREPFLLVDGIDRIDLQAGTLRGWRHISENDPVFAGHFPSDPVYPGVLLTEMVCQLGVCLLHLLSTKSSEVSADAVPQGLRLLKIHHALFLGGVGPGQKVILAAKALETSDYTSTCIGQVLVGDEVKVVVVSEVYMLDDDHEPNQ